MPLGQQPQKPKEWFEVGYHEQGSMESENEFEKLKLAGMSSHLLTRKLAIEDEDEQMPIAKEEVVWRPCSKGEYQDLLAPFDNTEDYSTASLMKNKGPNLTLEFLAPLTVDQMVRELLKKGSLIDYERLVRILKGACDLGKKQMPKESDLIATLINNYCLLSQKEGLLFCKSNIRFDLKTEKRQAALRDYIIYTLEKNGSVELSKIFEATETRYSELKEIIEEITVVKKGVCTLRSCPDSKFKSKLTENQLKIANDKWTSLVNDLSRYQENSFYQNDLSVLAAKKLNDNKKHLLLKRVIEEEVTKLLSQEIVSSYAKIMTHLGQVKGLVHFQPL